MATRIQQFNRQEFQYLRDPLFIACLAAYFINRVAESFGIAGPTLRYYLNDLICLPFWLPIVLQIARSIGFRKIDAPPSGLECGLALFIWATLFEVWLPETNLLAGYAIADPWDVIAYAIGGFVAQVWWGWWYGPLSFVAAEHLAAQPGCEETR